MPTALLTRTVRQRRTQCGAMPLVLPFEVVQLIIIHMHIHI